jgi:hypothetical protein
LVAAGAQWQRSSGVTAALDTDVSMSPAPIFDKSLLTRELNFTHDEDILDIEFLEL